MTDTSTARSPEAVLDALGATGVTAAPAGDDDVVDGVPAQVVARPESTEQVAAVLRATEEHRLTVVARGAGTKLTWGMPPRRVDVLVDTSGLAGVVEHAAGDLVVVVRAGTTLADLQDQLAGAGQRLALDQTVLGATVGGTVATATSGPSRMAFGTVRDLLIGVTVVRADGVVAKAGGKVVKNVAGYDLGKLVTGSYGTLAVITQAAFRLHPIPAARRFLRVGLDDADHAQRLVQAAVHSQAVPTAVELDWPADGPATVCVAVEGTAGGVDGRAATITNLLGPGTEQTDEPPAGWAVNPWLPGGVALKLTYAISALPQVLRAARSEPSVAGLHLRGSAGTGVLYAGLPADSDPAAVGALVDRLRAACGPAGGACVVLDAPAAVKQSVDVWGPVPGLELMRRVKDQFDPGHRLAPGRFVGGL